VRTYQEHVGQVVMAPRGGRVPGSVHVPWERALAGDGTFLPAARLAEVLGPQLSSGKDLIPYCQGGIRASLTWFCLHELLGRPARLYAGSWEEWARAKELPVESGSVAS
jgi:thiosulfate/3-mercaptopyruvate sulfurtransferase